MRPAARKLSQAQAKAAREKKIAIVGSIILLAVLGYEGPKILHHLHQSSPTPSARALAAPQVVTPRATLPQNDSAAPEAGSGQLVSFDRFKTKDPFVQQINTTKTFPAWDSNPPSTQPTSPTPPTPAKTPVVPSTPSTPTTTTATTTPTVPSTPAQPTTPAVPPSTTPAPLPAAPTSVAISTNGVCETVLAKGTFPSAESVFRLVSILLDGQSVRIAIAGGSFESGVTTVTLTAGSPLTLVNTADGVRYTLALVSSCPAAAAPTSTGPTTTTPTTTAPTP